MCHVFCKYSNKLHGQKNSALEQKKKTLNHPSPAAVAYTFKQCTYSVAMESQ